MQDFISFLVDQDNLHLKNLHFMRQYEKILASKAIYTGVPENKQSKIVQNIMQKSQHGLVLQTITNYFKPGSLDDGGARILELNLERVYFDTKVGNQAARTSVL